MDIQEIVIVIISQNNKYNLGLAQNLTQDVYEQSIELYQKTPVIHISNKDFPDKADWTFLPLFSYLVYLHQHNSSWVFFVQDYTSLRLKLLLEVFEKYDQTQEIWFGNALSDEAATIIHHFAFYDNPNFFKYPNLASGFAISIPLLIKLSNEWETDKTLTSNFHIDSGYELARFVWNDARGPMLEQETALCSTYEKPELCASFPSQFHTCDNLVPINNIYFAVKTCTKFHNDRVPIVKKTWGNHTPIIKFFSDKEDKSIPTIDLGVPNSENGHCMKTVAIIKYISKEIEINANIQWIVIADDDTILGVNNLRRLLSCYDYNEKLCLGERYGFELRDHLGYNYITGGGGMVFSRYLLTLLANNCICPSLTTPDDMYLGICMAKLGVDVTHVSGFHQARPSDYSPDYLASHEAISFHKHYMTDPVKIYKQRFETSDIADEEKKYHIEL